MVDHVLTDMNEYVSYGYYDSHKAVDIVGSGGTVSDVMAFDAGIVEVVVNNVKYTDHNTSGNATYGNYVKIKHMDGHKSLYAHLKYGSVLVSAGDSVSKGEKIATMGNTGNAYGTHLHFEVRNSDESRENPLDYLNGNSTITNPVNENTDSDTEDSSNSIVNVSNSSENNEVVTSSNDVDNASSSETEAASVVNDVKSSTNRKYVSNSSEEDDQDDYLSNSNYHGGSIVDGLKGIGSDSSFDYRSQLARVNGITNYRGSYSQNVYLLGLLKSGKLIKA